MQRVTKGWKAYQKAFSSGKEYAYEALELFEGAVETLREIDDRGNLPLALDGMGACFHLLGTGDDIEQARGCYNEEMKLLERSGSKEELVQVISSQQAVLRDLALLSPASAFLYLEEGLKLGERGMTLATKTRDERSLAWVTKTTADLCCVLARIDSVYTSSHLDTAIDLYEKAVVLWDRVMERGHPGERQSHGARAGSRTPESGGMAGAGQVLESKTLTLLGLSQAYIMQGKNLDIARSILDQARFFYSSGRPDLYQLAHVESLYGDLALAEGNREEASLHFGEAAGAFDRLGFSYRRV